MRGRELNLRIIPRIIHYPLPPAPRSISPPWKVFVKFNAEPDTRATTRRNKGKRKRASREREGEREREREKERERERERESFTALLAGKQAGR